MKVIRKSGQYDKLTQLCFAFMEEEMAIGQSMARRCPDQSKTEAARVAYVDKAMKNSQPKEAPKPTPKAKVSNSYKAMLGGRWNPSATGKRAPKSMR